MSLIAEEEDDRRTPAENKLTPLTIPKIDCTFSP